VPIHVLKAIGAAERNGAGSRLGASESPSSSTTTVSEHNSDEFRRLFEKNNNVNTSNLPKNYVLCVYYMIIIITIITDYFLNVLL